MKKTKEEFIEEANKIHNNKYDYLLTNYINNKTLIEISCPIHGIFNQTPKNHLKGHGCLKCSGKEKITREKFTERANNIHNNKYEYDLTNYKHIRCIVDIICPQHGPFKQRGDAHLSGQGCSVCKGGVLLTKDNFIKRAKKIHGKEYNYSEVIYTNARTKVKIICSIHGVFEQTPDNHIDGHGCSKCTNQKSQGEKELLEYIKSIYDKRIHSRKYDIIPPYEIDIYLPAKKLAFEYCGLYFHSNVFKDKDYHLKKLEMCEKKGIKLITIFEDEWILKNYIVKNEIIKLLGLYTPPKIGYEETVIKELSSIEYHSFINKYHIGGCAPVSKRIGLFYNNELISAMGFEKDSEIENNWVLSRYSTKHNVDNDFNYLLNYFINNNDINEISIFVDRRYDNEDNICSKNGFVITDKIEPNFFYFRGINRIFYNDNKNDLNWVYDCGMLKYSLGVEK